MKKKRETTPEERTEAAKLKAIYRAKKRELKLSQEALGVLLDITQAGVSHYLPYIHPTYPSPSIASSNAVRRRY